MSSNSIHYNLRFPRIRQHLVDVEAFFPATDSSGNQNSSSMVVAMPVWTPGSYLIREYARNIESIEAFDATNGAPLSIEKLSKNRWSIETLESQVVCLRYSLYCRESSVRTNWIEEEYGFLTGAATFLTLDDQIEREHSFTILPPDTWPTIACSLPSKTSELAGPDCNEIWFEFTRVAKSFDELVDSPILMGDLAIRSFEVSGKMHYLACYGTNGTWDLERATADCTKIVETQHAFWGEVPYSSYWFINLALESYGGLEHDNNTVLITSRWAMCKRASYVEWLGLVSHEFFHTWNVRRLRPKNLLQYDYGAEQYIAELWIAEGITSYFDDLLVLRAGLATQTEYLGLLDKILQQVEEAPGRLVQSLKDSSFDTWIKHYRPDENTINSRISYYTKGAVVAFLLDVLLRKATDNRYSLADVIRQLWNSYREEGYTLANFESIASELAGKNLSLWFDKHIRRSDQLDYREAFEWLGLQRESMISHESTLSPAGSGLTEPDTPQLPDEPEWELGCETAIRDGRIVVSKILRNSPASMGGLQVDDELIAINDYRLPKDNWKDRLQCYRGTNAVTVLVARRGRIREVPMSMRQKQVRKLQSISTPSQVQSQNRLAWLFR